MQADPNLVADVGPTVTGQPSIGQQSTAAAAAAAASSSVGLSAPEVTPDPNAPDADLYELPADVVRAVAGMAIVTSTKGNRIAEQHCDVGETPEEMARIANLLDIIKHCVKDAQFRVVLRGKIVDMNFESAVAGQSPLTLKTLEALGVTPESKKLPPTSQAKLVQELMIGKINPYLAGPIGADDISDADVKELQGMYYNAVGRAATPGTAVTPAIEAIRVGGRDEAVAFAVYLCKNSKYWRPMFPVPAFGKIEYHAANGSDPEERRNEWHAHVARVNAAIVNWMLMDDAHIDDMATRLMHMESVSATIKELSKENVQELYQKLQKTIYDRMLGLHNDQVLNNFCTNRAACELRQKRLTVEGELPISEKQNVGTTRIKTK